MAVPEDIEQFLVGDAIWVVVDLDRLRVVAKAIVSGIVCAASRVADSRPDDTGETPEPGVRAPESAKREGSRHRLVWCRRINGRDAVFFQRHSFIF